MGVDQWFSLSSIFGMDSPNPESSTPSVSASQPPMADASPSSESSRRLHLPQVEGFGEEVLWTLIITLLTFGILALIYFRRRLTSRSEVGLHQSRDGVGPGHSITSETLLQAQPGMQYGSTDTCAVCLNDFRYPTQTNCGHAFCAQCILHCWTSRSILQPTQCPVCRQMVNILLPLGDWTTFSSSGDSSATDPAVSVPERAQAGSLHEESNESGAGRAEEPFSDARQMRRTLCDYNRRFSGAPRPWLDYIYDAPVLLRHMWSRMFTVGGLMQMFRLRLVMCTVGAVFYLISPLDVIPESVFGLLGIVDDIFVAFLFAIYISVVYRRYIAQGDF